MQHKKQSLTLRKIQEVANAIDACKGRFDQQAGKELAPDYTMQWSGEIQFWMARFRARLKSRVDKITEVRNNLIKKHGTKKQNIYEFKDLEAFELDVKNLLDKKDTVQIPVLKASDFLKKEGEVWKSLVPMPFWEVFNGDLIVMDVDVFKFEEDKEEADFEIEESKITEDPFAAKAMEINSTNG